MHVSRLRQYPDSSRPEPGHPKGRRRATKPDRGFWVLAGSYRDVLDATRTVLAELSPAEHSAVFGRTAIEVYRLAVDSH